MSKTQTSWGPRLIARPTARLRAAVLVVPQIAIANAHPLAGEPNASYPRALAQHGILAQTLRYVGCETYLLEAQSEDPYAAAIADAAVLFESGAVMMRPSQMTRRPQSAWLEAEFERMGVPITEHLIAPGLLDGSDVLLIETTAFIGISKQSNALGRSGFAQIARAHGFDPVEVRLADNVRSLRSVAGVLSCDRLLLAPADRLDHAAFRGFKTVVAARGNDLGLGVLNLGEDHVVGDVRFRDVNEMLRRSGVRVEAIDLYDFDRIGIAPSMLAVDLKRS